MEPTTKLNLRIFQSYLQYVTEGENSKTGFIYPDGIDDECVRAHAEDHHDAPVYLFQVVAVRRFMESMFPSDRVTGNDVRRIRRFFIGRLISEYPGEHSDNQTE
jgi:hypothetical protein